MQVFRTLAGYSLGRADIVRRAMAKKKHAVMQKEREFFLYGEKDDNGNLITKGAVANGVEPKIAEKIFDDMSSFSSYAFNKAHACAYSFVAYRTAYLKCHYPAEYFAALMTGTMDSASKLSLYTAECRKTGIKILPPSVNHSGKDFTPDAKTIRFGLLAVKNLGISVIERLIAEREQNGPYTSFYDFCLRNYSREFNRKALESLVKSGAMDCLSDNRREMLYNIEGVLSAVENERRFSGQGQLDLFEEMGSPNTFVMQPVPEMSQEMRLLLEKEATGLYLSGHPLDKYEAFLKNAKLDSLTSVIEGKYTDGKRITVAGIVSGLKVRQLKNNNLLATAQIEGISASVNITVFDKAYMLYKNYLTDTKPIILTGRISEREDRDTEIICEKIEAIPENLSATFSKEENKVLWLRLESTESPEFEEVKTVLAQNKGDIPVNIFCTKTNKRLSAPKSLYVTENENLVARLEAILGKENIKFTN